MSDQHRIDETISYDPHEPPPSVALESVWPPLEQQAGYEFKIVVIQYFADKVPYTYYAITDIRQDNVFLHLRDWTGTEWAVRWSQIKSFVVIPKAAWDARFERNAHTD